MGCLVNLMAVALMLHCLYSHNWPRNIRGRLKRAGEGQPPSVALAKKKKREVAGKQASKQASKGAGRLGMSPLHCSSKSNTSYTSYWRVCDGTVFSTNVNR